VIALIDYDNLDVQQRRLGVRYVMSRLLQVLGRQWLAGERNVECRLYGGWFDEASLSPAAQQLLPEVQREFPSSMAVAGRDGAHVLLVRAELARALICDPGVELTHTYRRRSLPPRLRCISTPFPNCAEPSRCPVAGVEPFIRDGACPADGCVVTPGAVLARAEQKLVDSMITIDLVHLAEATSESLVVVSADDDLWPGIRFVLLRGAQVVHVVPRRGGSGPDRYRRLKTAKYTQVAI